MNDKSSSTVVKSQAVIRDEAELSRFRRKRLEWLELFKNGKTSVVSIHQQLMDAIVSDLIYRVFNEESAKHTIGEGYAVPSLLYLLNVGYVTSQALLARRLLDKRSDVASLSRILKDIQKNKKLITRENFVAHDGTVYDPDVLKAINTNEQELEYRIFGIDGASFDSHRRSYNRHKRFDFLSGTTETNRNKTDVIHKSIFDTLERWLESPEALRLKLISDNRYAHASDGSKVEFKDLGDDLAAIEVEVALRGFVRVSQAVFGVLLNREIFEPVVPMIPLGSFGTVWNGSDLVPSTSRMQWSWDKLVEQRNSWAHKVDDKLFSESFNPP